MARRDRSAHRPTLKREYPISPLLVMAHLPAPKDRSHEAGIKAEAAIFDTVVRALVQKHGADEDAVKEALEEIEKNGIGPEGDRLIDGVRVLLKRYGEPESFLISALDPVAARLWADPDVRPVHKMALAATVFPYAKVMGLLRKWFPDLDEEWIENFDSMIDGSSSGYETDFEWPMKVFMFTARIDRSQKKMNDDIMRALGRELSLDTLYRKAPHFQRA